MKGFLSALGFLTAFPLPVKVNEDRAALAGSSLWFPAVGLLFGAALAAADHWLLAYLPAPARAVLVVLLWIAFSRGIHMDGLADSADGLLSHKPREKTLEIMRDPRSGPMAVMAVVGVMALKMALVYGLEGDRRWPVLLLAPFAGRAALTLTMSFFPYAREGGGLATPFHPLPSRGAAAGVFLVLLVPIALLWPRGALGAALSLLAAFLIGKAVARRLGGYTGDTLGAACELTETAFLLLALSSV